MQIDEFNRFVLGALLHDIGKFKQRADFEEDKGKNHSLIGYEWLSSHYGEGIVAAAARNHHGYEEETRKSNLSLLIYEADNLAASERREFDVSTDLGKHWHREVLLASDFSRIRLEGEGLQEVSEPSMKYWPLARLGGWLLPQDSDSGGSNKTYRDLWEAFCQDFGKLKNAGRHLDVEVMIHLLEKYTSFIPSITLHITGATELESFRKHPDVSLFDHAKVTAAASGCLYRFYSSLHKDRWNREILRDEITGGWDKDEEKPFLLVGGDLSGVQKFIYTISSRGALKALKGRSFFLELFIEHLVDSLIERLSLTRCNVLFTGGGHFYLLAPNTHDAKGTIQDVRQKTNDYLWDSFNGELSCCIAYVPMGKRAFKDATPHWAALGQELEAMKRRKWEERIQDVFGPPAMPHKECLTARCEVCAREDMPLRSVKEVLMCPSCREQFLFGEELQKTSREASRGGKGCIGIGVWDELTGDEDGFLRIAAGGRVRFYKPFLIHGNSHRALGPRWAYRLNDWDAGGYVTEGDRPLMGGMFHAGEFEDLESLVERGYGWNRAAVLRMDVDRLGKIFSSGLPQNDRTFSRMASLSRHFSLFFKYHLNGVLDLRRKEGYDRIPRTRLVGNARKPERLMSVVYSGGDDLFLIGHWLDVFEAAFDVHEAFSSLTANPFITLSAGLAFAAPHHPVYRFAEDAGKAEQEAKNAGRNSLTILGHTLTWEQARDMLSIVREEILPLLQEGENALDVPRESVSRGFFHKLLELVRPLIRGRSDTGQGEQFWLLPKAAYLTGRAGPSKQFLSKTEEAKTAWAALRDRLLCQPREEHLRKIEGAVVWSLMMMRKGE